jgi:hypothetical protein
MCLAAGLAVVLSNWTDLVELVQDAELVVNTSTRVPAIDLRSSMEKQFRWTQKRDLVWSSSSDLETLAVIRFRYSEVGTIEWIQNGDVFINSVGQGSFTGKCAELGTCQLTSS